MILTCPACSTRFLVPDTAFGDKPRRVRCGQCKHEWVADAPPPPPPPPLPIPDLPAPEVEPYLSMEEEKKPEIPVTPPPAEPKPIPKGSSLPVPLKDKIFIRRALIALGVLLLIAVLSGGYLYATATGRDTVFSSLFTQGPAAPQLSIENVKTKYVEVTPTGAIDPAAPVPPKSWVLVVEGTVRNKSGWEVALPPLILATKDANGALLKLYRPDVQMKNLPPEGTTGFTYTISEVSEKLAEVTVQFGSGVDIETGQLPADQAEPAAPAAPTEDHGDGGH